MSNKKYGITLDGKEHEVTISPLGSNNYSVSVNGEVFSVSVRDIPLESISNHILRLSQNCYEYTG